MLTDEEIERLTQGIIATVASPLIGSIEDYAWEAIFHSETTFQIENYSAVSSSRNY